MSDSINQIALVCQAAIDTDTMVNLTVPRKPTGAKIRLTPEAGPLGEIVNYSERTGRTLARFDPIEVLAFLAAQGLVGFEVKR